MKKRIALIGVLAILVFSIVLAGCSGNANFVFDYCGYKVEDFSQIEVSHKESTKVTSQQSKIKDVFEKLKELSIPAFKGKVEKNVFTDSVYAKITITFANKQKLVMTFANTTVDEKKVCLLKCEGEDGFKLPKEYKGIFEQTPEKAQTFLTNLFYNVM